MLSGSNATIKLTISVVAGILLSGLLLASLPFSQAATAASSAALVPGYPIELVPDQMALAGDVATGSNCVDPTVCSWLAGTPTGTIILGIDPASPDSGTWDGGSATAHVFLPNVYSPTVLVLKISWPNRDGKGLHSPERNRTGTITLDGQTLWDKRTISLSTFNDYYAAEHDPILTTIVVTQSATHTLSFSVPARTAWDLSQIKLDAYPYPTKLRGIGYSPYRDCQYPGGDFQASASDIEDDLFRLSHTTNAIRTYAATGVNASVPARAQALGLAIFPGAWLNKTPEDDAEIQALITMANTIHPDGVIVGSEYYLRHRTDADINVLLQAIIRVKNAIPADVPVTTAELDNLMFDWRNSQATVPLRINAHYRPILDQVDFVMVHIYPFWNRLPIDGAAALAVNRYKGMQALLDRTYPGQHKRLIIGETGWPSAGGPQQAAVPSLENQRRYLLEFLRLAEEKGVEYLYFDTFDELWKIEEGEHVGQHWGYSYSDRTAKHNFYGVLLPANELAGQSALDASGLPLGVRSSEATSSLSQASSSPTFAVYTEWPMGPGAHFVPSGWMGMTQTLALYECDRTDPYNGEMAVRASFSPTSTGSWGGIYWQQPENNWGQVEKAGTDLNNATYLRFHARGERGGEKVKFLMGGIWGDYPDSQQPALSTDVITLTQEWVTYTLDLRGRDLSYVIGGFAFVADGCLDTEPITFYLDDIEYVLEGDPGAPAPAPPQTPYTFDIYRDRDIAGNHYVPSGWMGDTGDVRLNECWRENTHSGSTAIRAEYTAQGSGPDKWAGVYWQDPADNWGDRPGGYNLTGARALTFWARGEKGGENITFEIGGIGCKTGAYPDSLCPVRVFDPAPTTLATTWQVYTIPLSPDLDLRHLAGGLLWTASRTDNPTGAVFYLDDIQYVFNVDMPSTFPFSTPPIPIGDGSSNTFDLAFGDADKDGRLDLAIGSHGANQICWNNGDRTFDCQDAFGGDVTFNVAWGDMNGDGYLDLVVSNSRIGNDYQPNLVCLNNRDRTFTCESFSFCTGDNEYNQPCHVALGDVDGDGDLDIALGNWMYQDVIYYNKGDGTFLPDTTNTCTARGWDRAMEFGDMDKDGDQDLVVVGDSPDYICLNNGTGIVTDTRWLTWRIDTTESLALGDMDGDGNPDVVAGESSMHQNEVYLHPASHDFPDTLLFDPVEEETWSVALGDIDGDGDLDLAEGNTIHPTVVYFNEPVDGPPGFTLTNPIVLGDGGYRTQSVAFGDVDRDGDLDLAVGKDSQQKVIYLNVSRTYVYLPLVLRGYR